MNALQLAMLEDVGILLHWRPFVAINVTDEFHPT